MPEAAVYMLNRGNTCYLPDFPGMLSLTDFAVLPSSRPYQLHVNRVTHLFWVVMGQPFSTRSRLLEAETTLLVSSTEPVQL